MSTKRFRIAFSFAGEKRDFVVKVAAILAKRFGESAILYDKYHEAEFAIYDLGIRLPKLYGEESELIVPVLCPSYDIKRWTGWEWVHIYGLLTRTDGHRVMPCRFDRANADGLSPTAGFIELDDKTPDQFAALILERLALNEGKPKDHYLSNISNIVQSGSLVPGFLSWFLDNYFPVAYRVWRRWRGSGDQSDPPGVQSYLEDLRAHIKNDLREKTYIPVVSRSVSQTIVDDVPTNDPFLWPVHAYMRELVGDAAGGDSANAQIAAVNRRSRLVRNILHKLDHTKRPLILLGDPGSGKTMTLEQAALLLAEREHGRAFPLIPIYVRLGDFHVSKGDVNLTHVMDHVRRAVSSSIAPHVERLVADGRVVIFFDGMDEMSRDRYNSHIEALSLFASRYSRQHNLLLGIEGTKTLFSCRIADFSPKFIHERLVLLPFDRHQIREFLKNYLRAFPIEIDGRSWRLTALSRHLVSDSLTVDAVNPFSLWLLCVYLRGPRKQWPASRVDMLRFYNELNYDRKNEELRKAGKSLLAPMGTTFFHWGQIAFKITSRNRGASISVAALLCGGEQKRTRDAIEAGKLCGILRESKEQHEHLLRFNHHRFQEFFTALYINEVDPDIQWLDKLDAPRWQETMFNLILMGGADDVVEMFACEVARLVKMLQKSYGLETLEEISPPEQGSLRGRPWRRRIDFDKLIPNDLETALADRAELASRILKQKSDREELLRKILASPFSAAVRLLAEHGNPITQVKMLRACQNVPELGQQLSKVLQTPLNSKVRWVRNQALILIASRKASAASLIGSDLPTEIGLDLANGRLLNGISIFLKAAAAAKAPGFRWCLFAGVLSSIAAFIMLLAASAGLYAGACSLRSVKSETPQSFEDLFGFKTGSKHLAGHLSRWFPKLEEDAQKKKEIGSRPVQSPFGPFAILKEIKWRILFVLVIFLATGVSLARDPPRMWLWVLGTAALTPFIIVLLSTLWKGNILSALISVVFAFLLFTTGHVIAPVVASGSHIFSVYSYLLLTAPWRSGGPSKRTLVSTAWRSGGYDVLLKSKTLWAQLGRAYIVAMPFVLIVPWILLLLCVIAETLDSWSHLPFHPLVNASVVVFLGLLLVSSLWSWRKSNAKPLIFNLLLVGFLVAVAAVIWLAIHLPWLQPLFRWIAALPWGFVLRLCVVALSFVLFWAFYTLTKDIFRVALARILSPTRLALVGQVDLEQWTEVFTKSIPEVKQVILLQTTPQTLQMTGEEFLTFLKALEPHVKREPAVSTYWDQRDKLEHALRQERDG